MSENPDDQDSNDLALERTGLAEDRNIMAMERTFAGWIRTSFAAIGIGLAFRVVFGDFDPPWLAKVIATMFVAAGGWLAIIAQKHARTTLKRLHSHHLEPISAPNFMLLGHAVAFGSGILIAGFWILDSGIGSR